MLEHKVDLINTDDLEGAQHFLEKEQGRTETQKSK